MLPQPGEFVGGVGQLAFQRLVLFADLEGRGAERVHYATDSVRILFVQRLGGGGQLLAIGLAGFTRRFDGARDGIQFRRQALARVENFAVQLGRRQVVDGNGVTHLFGEAFA